MKRYRTKGPVGGKRAREIAAEHDIPAYRVGMWLSRRRRAEREIREAERHQIEGALARAGGGNAARVGTLGDVIGRGLRRGSDLETEGLENERSDTACDADDTARDADFTRCHQPRARARRR